MNSAVISFQSEAHSSLSFSTVVGTSTAGEAPAGGATTAVQPELPPTNVLPKSSRQHLPLPVHVTPIIPRRFPPVPVDKQDSSETPTVSSDLNVPQLPAEWQIPLNEPKLPPIPTSPGTFGSSPQQRQRDCFPLPIYSNSVYQSDEPRTAADQSASTKVRQRKQKVAASRETDEDVKNNNLDKLVAKPSNLEEVITIDDSDVEDASCPLPRESLSQHMVDASCQTTR